MICILDYGVGNVASIKNMLKKIGVAATVSAKPEDITGAEKLILPGVGAFDMGMTNLRESGLLPLLNEQVLEKGKPCLGICLGMQLMTKGSEEGVLPGLGWIDAQTRHFDFAESPVKLPVPHMGWGEIESVKSHPLVDDLPPHPRFYFVHSYFVDCRDESDVMVRSRYGHTFVAGFARGNVAGVQFHPEKSHKFGMALLKGFAHGLGNGLTQRPGSL